jgi:metacaspase-1
VLLISGCQDDQLSMDGMSNGLFTETLLGVWDEGRWQGDYPSFHQAIVAKMPQEQQPNLMQVGDSASGFQAEDPLQ